MTERKERLTVTVDRSLVDAANEAVASGRTPSVSAWVNVALAERATKERRMRAMSAAVAAYEAQFGEISDEELVAQARQDQRTAVVVRGGRRKRA